MPVVIARQKLLLEAASKCITTTMKLKITISKRNFQYVIKRFGCSQSFFFVMYVCTYSCYAWVRLEWTGRIGQMNIAAYFVRFGLIKSKRVTVWMES